jgi:signal transduction histidine kinase
MNEAAAKLSSRVVRWVIAFSAATTLLFVSLIPELLLLGDPVASEAADRELMLLAAAGTAALVVVAARLRRHRYLLRALALGSRSVEPFELEELGREPGRLTRRWLLPHVAAEAVLATPLRPRGVDVTTGTSLALLGAIVAAAASLLLYVVIRALFLRAMELAPPEVMREVIEAAERKGDARFRIQRRLRTAVATPVALVAVGSALVANAHVRRADEYGREALARAIARSTLELGPGIIGEAGIEDATAYVSQIGFSARVSAEARPYTVERGDHGLTVLTTPLDTGSAELRFHGSTVPVLGAGPIVIAVLTVLAAAALGNALGRAHTVDLQHATDGIRLLGTEAVLRGGRLPVSPPKFQVVGELEAAIERLAERFRVFAKAQERAILAREAATRTRGLFFASVSHDLKNPLNSILGFAELVRLEPLTPGQAESLEVIDRRGRELLALIETILDAARVEAGQLSLILESTKTGDLFRDAFDKTRQLESERALDVVGEIADGARELVVDRVRMARALATLVAFAARQTRVGQVHVRAIPDGPAHALIQVDVPGRRDAAPLARLLTAAGRPGAGEHRGLALGLSLARSIVELHGGTLRAVDGPSGIPAFSIRMPTIGPAAT